MGVVRAEALGEHVLDARQFHHGADASTRDHARTVGGGAQEHASRTELALHGVGNGSLGHGHADHGLAGALDGLADGLGHFLGLARAVADPAFAVAHDDQEFDQRTLQIHQAPDTKSDLLYKNALLERARTIFSGLIVVDPDAQKTDAYQSNRNLMLSDEAEANSLPGLEIQANDIRCTHGATTSRIDPEQEFYLQARGIAKEAADELLIFDRAQQTITILVNAVLDDATSPTEAYENALAEIDRLISLLEQRTEHIPATLPSEVAPAPFESNTTKEKFIANVLEAKTHITAGDIIQVVGSQRFSVPLKASPLDLYRAARTINPSPYMFLLELDGFALVGVSPEIHVRCEDRLIEIRPIAGTRPRGTTHDEDLTMEKELLADPKERAEHVMLVDLARNDIGRVCDYGSVQVKELMVIERYSHVMHIVSQVEGHLAADKNAFDLMRATFPAGTVSGAPKIRAMQIISELEGTTRGPYAGCVGYFSFNGNCDTAITIRTMEETLGARAAHTLPTDAKTAREAANQGVPVFGRCSTVQSTMGS